MYFVTKPFIGTLVFLGLSACQVDQMMDQPEKTYPPEVAAALPTGVPTSIVFTSEDGCYAYSIEETTPQVGYPLRDRSGNVICKK